MKRVQLSGTKKRQLSKKQQGNSSKLELKTFRKITFILWFITVKYFEMKMYGAPIFYCFGPLMVLIRPCVRRYTYVATHAAPTQNIFINLSVTKCQLPEVTHPRHSHSTHRRSQLAVTLGPKP